MHVFFLGGERQQEEKEDTCEASLAKEVTGRSRRVEAMAEEAAQANHGAKRRRSMNAVPFPKGPREHRREKVAKRGAGRKKREKMSWGDC